MEHVEFDISCVYKINIAFLWQSFKEFKLNMLLKRNLLESLTLFFCSGSFICILLNYVTDISPITGIWFPIYTIFLCLVSLTCSLKVIQWLIRCNKPLKYDVDKVFKEYPSLSFLARVLPEFPKPVRPPKFSEEYKEYDTNELSVISTVLERRLVSSWYVPFISQEIGFPFACKQMMDQMIGKAFQICNKIETKEVCIDATSVLIMHLKEYKKALKRHENNPNSTVETLYKKTHPISNDDKKKIQSADHCILILRIIFKELVPWELWDTPHSELLIRILSKKLDAFIDSTIADPVWLNNKLLTLLSDTKAEPVEMKVVKEEVIKTTDKPEATLDRQNNDSPPKAEVDPKKAEETTIEGALSTLITKTTAPILHRAIKAELQDDSIDNDVEVVTLEDALEVSGPVEVQASPVMRQRRGRQGKSEVKIYDRIIEGSVKTWETDMDLQCISLGQDLLASLNEASLDVASLDEGSLDEASLGGELVLSRLWGGRGGGC
ncbi:hypothetical protein JYU34_010022 [Plutella xylostella]|uniref:PXA domain-containing protein n=1 Tax=Plutella xylostella TaxID=51655 RepID=A0ABQ7QHH0_PLUXY|nr:hypothetical protein JYU34_010022 [Plutella xylostella]